MSDIVQKLKKVGVISLGCDKNRVDTENMLHYLQGRYLLTQKIEEADVIVVNTCAFINSAREEAIDTILDAAAYHPEKLIVTGCLPQKYVSEIFDELPEADAFLGTSSYDKIADIIDELYRTNERINAVNDRVTGFINTDRVLTTPYHYAYLKIAEGCDNHCTYCTIPSIRGKYQSRDAASLIAEASKLALSGAKELILVAQDVTRYGEDRGENELVPLICRLSKIEGIEWLRLLYCYPESVTDALIDEIKNNPKVVKYVDIPFQHVSSPVLKRMGRRIDGGGIRRLIDKLRREIPQIAIRSTFIVGFPGESDAQFDELCAFLKEYKLDNAGFFAYSREEGTPAARLDGQIDEEIKKKRVERAYAVQHEVVIEKNTQAVGKTVRVLFDGIDYEEDAFFGRSMFAAPEIDGKVFLSSDNVLEAGNFYDVEIIGCYEYDLKGVVKNEFAK